MLKVKLTKNHLFKGSFIVLLGNAVANFFNYLYHLLTGRLLTPSQYGLLQSLIALTYFLGVFVSSFSFVVINIIGQAKKAEVHLKIKWLEKKALVFTLLFWLFFLSLFPLFQKFLHLKRFLVYFFFTLPVLFSFFSTLYQSVLRAKLEFTKFSFTIILATFVKLVSALILIIAGWQVIGALSGLIIASIAGMVLGWHWVKNLWPEIPRTIKSLNFKTNFWNFSLLSFVTNFSLVSLYSTDILLVRHFFSPYKAGLYSATAVLGKIIFFAATAVLLVVFPLFVKYKKNIKKLFWTFWLSFLFISTICLIGLSFYKLFPHLIVSLLYGEAYSQASAFLPYFAIFILLVSIFNLLAQLLLALESTLAGWLTGLVAIGQILLILVRHQSLKTVIDNSVLILFLGLFLGLLLVNHTINAQKK